MVIHLSRYSQLEKQRGQARSLSAKIVVWASLCFLAVSGHAKAQTTVQDQSSSQGSSPINSNSTNGQDAIGLQSPQGNNGLQLPQGNNGLQLPQGNNVTENVQGATGTATATVIVSPSVATITNQQFVKVAVSVAGGIGMPTPSGTIILVEASSADQQVFGTSAVSLNNPTADMSQGGNSQTPKPYGSQQTLIGGVATFTIPTATLTPGSNTLIATYTGDATYGAMNAISTITVECPVSTAPLGMSQSRMQGACGAAGFGPRAATQMRSFPSRTGRARRNPAAPNEVQNPDPYGNIPSLRDLYTQIPSAGGTLRRFGSDAFLVGTGNVNELPMDLPVGPDYVLGPGDVLVLNMWGGVASRLNVMIDRQGQIALPEAGTISLVGLTITQAQSAIQKALGTQFQNEHVELSLGRVRTVRVYVVGDVQRPGAYDVSSLSTPLNALYEAGGPTSRGSLRILEQFRGKQLIQKLDLYDFLLRGIRTNFGHLEPGDTILVPPVGPQVTIEGMVHRPAIYELNGENNLQQVLNLAGGVLIKASLKQINVERIVAHERRTMLSLKLPSDQSDITKELISFEVQGGDEVVVSQILPYNQQAVYLEGHVYRPGKYPYHDGMTITDLLHSYQDVMPEPAAHAEIVRLEAPDFRPETINFNLPDVLIGNESILLKPFDVVHIYGRYEIDPPRVSIAGEVLRPGDYPMSQGMTAADLVRMAGGFKRSAYRDEADLSSYVVQNGQKVLVNHSNVAISKALEGDKSADAALKPGDVLSIRRLAGSQDIGASVTVNGEVEHPGSYGIEDGERLSSFIKRAGGFTKVAYPAAAVLERVEVRQLNEQARQQMILRIENTPIPVNSGTAATNPQAATAMQQSMQLQREQILQALRSHPASGRLVIHIDSDISKWENTPADIELRAGDTLLIPKRPNFVDVNGQVYNPVAISYLRGKHFDWYLKQAGGPTRTGDKKNIYVLRADGSVVVPEDHRSIWMGGGLENIRMHPGDTILVPEKIVGGSALWQNIMSTAMIASTVATPLAFAGVL